jgi:beta-phosphoglucomutase
MAMRAVIFDFDGVLVDSEPSHYRALRDCLLAEGISLTPEEYAQDYLAYDDRQCLRIAFERRGLPPDEARVETAARRKARIYEDLLNRVPLFEGARELIDELSGRIPLAIASGALAGEIDRILAAAGLREAFATVVGADNVTRCKPHPEPYLTAMRRLRTALPDLMAGECLVFEDSVPGITAGLAAGMKVVGVAHTYPAAKLQAAHRVVPALKGVRGSAMEDLF